MLLNIESDQFNFYFPADPHHFVSETFTALNAKKADKIMRLVQNTDKVAIGLIAGVKNNVLLSPFSAPFGGFHFKNESIYSTFIESFVEDLKEFAVEENITQIKITLPPDIYCQSFNAKLINVLVRLGFKMNIPEITNWVDLHKFKGLYTHNASRTYYNQAVKNKLEFSKTESVTEKEAIYNLIVENRSRMGRPIFMTFNDVLQTAEIFPTEFFKVVNPNGEFVAGAIFYTTNPTIAFAVFWADSQQGRTLRAMDFLIFHLWSYYKEAGYRYIDLGTSTESGVPNEGLLRFKETHECISSSRFSFSWTDKEKQV